jgi:type I restriction enzyme S subunit
MNQLVFGEICKWPVKRLRFLIRRQISDQQRQKLVSAKQVSFLPMEAIGEQGEFDASAIREKEDVETGYSVFFDGDIIVAKITPCFENGKGALVQGLLNGVGFGTTELRVLTPNKEFDGRFLFYITASEPFRKQGEASMTGAAGQKRVTDEFIKNFRVAVPSLAEQEAIAAYLDRETGRLGALMAAKKNWLELLAEKRLALITRAVTRGLNPTAPLRDSGFLWLGQVPEHWRVERAKWLFKERDERIENDDGEMLTVSHITGVTKRSEKDVNMFEAETTEGYKICKKSDLAINTLWAWMGAMGIAPCDGIVSPAYNVYKPGPEMDGGYVEALVRMPIFAQEITRYSTGVWSSRLRLYPEGFFEAWLPVPPLDEQRAIVAHIATATAKLDGLRTAAERTIALLKERRAALIAAAVTGKIQIPFQK